MLHNRIVAPFIYQVLDARGWSVSKLALEAGTKRSVLAAQLSGTRRFRVRHIMQYARLFDHQERRGLLAAWLRDYMSPELTAELLNATGDDLSVAVKSWSPALSEDDEDNLAWWAREITRDPELHELFLLIGTRAGYRPKRTTAGPLKRKRRG